ncbi:MAG: dihydropteroate synthase [Planctomycetota bacterium]|nr:MAG: dihydropteroate synthase [Planctomycetota bacterium]REK20392.1 MAG: dihydropteroate synthase [Planctomycetota bacterium]REK26889.1 MAG: dihydropteroate synthase [Planctomycetota bacterium]
MGIVNVTPDSFSDGGRWLDPNDAVSQALQLVEDGADILDIGGESTRPGADPVSQSDELRRVIPVIQRLADRTDVPLSVDTTKAEVARQALAAGATIVNDISGLTFDREMTQVCADSDCGVICMHIRGTPQTMQDDPQYENVVVEVRDHLRARLNRLVAAGIEQERIVLDPGIGFGKTAGHNLELLSSIGTLRELGRPILIGHSRKRFLKKLLGREIDERQSGTIGVAIAAAAQHADILRIHDVRSVKDALLAWHAIARRIR